jgi:hypothetical protein
MKNKKELLKSRKELKSLKELNKKEAWDNIKKIKQILLRVRSGEFITPAIGEILDLLSQERKKVVEELIKFKNNNPAWIRNGIDEFLKSLRD